VNGISVRASAWSRDRTTGAWAKAYLGAYGGGLGVTDTSEDGLNDTHTVDNVDGRDNYVVFEFSSSVIVNRAFLGYVVGDSDLTAWIGTKSGAFTTAQSLSDAYLAGLLAEDNNTAETTTRWADINAPNTPGNILVIAASTSDTTPEDHFKIQKLDICTPQVTQPPADCVPFGYDFTGSTATSGTAGNIRTYVVDGVSVKVSAFSRTTAGTWAKAYLGAYAGGLGVTDANEGTGSNDEHTVDNNVNNNYVLFEFSQPVTVDRAFLGYVVGDSDLSLWIGNATDPFNNHLTLSDLVLTGLGARENNDTTLSTTRWADFNPVQKVGNVLVIAASVLNDGVDKFKIQKLNVCATPAPTCPSPWVSKDQDCTVAGYSSYFNNCYTVKGAGSDIYGTADQFRYVYQPASGDCSIICRVAAEQNTDLWAKAGLMIRETLTGRSKCAGMFLTPGNGIALQCRTANGGTTSSGSVTGPTAPYWLKLTRTGSTFAGYYSTNGTTWIACGSQTISMAGSVYIGMAVSSHDATKLCTATFDNVTCTP